MNSRLALRSFPMLLLGVLLLVSCTKRSVRLAAPPMPPPKGEVSIKILQDTDAAKKNNPEGWEFQAPRLLGDPAIPGYPEAALKARFGAAVSIVRIVIGSQGEVTEVQKQAGSTPGPFSDDFFHAAETAVRQWRFTHPEWWRVEEGKDLNGDGKPDYQKVVERKESTSYGDIEFRFKIVGNRGEVRAGK